MKHENLHQRIAELEMEESNKKHVMEQGFERFAENLKPANIAKNAMLNVTGKAKTLFSKIFRKSSS